MIGVVQFIVQKTLNSDSHHRFSTAALQHQIVVGFIQTQRGIYLIQFVSMNAILQAVFQWLGIVSTVPILKVSLFNLFHRHFVLETLQILTPLSGLSEAHMKLHIPVIQSIPYIQKFS
jgi:hypothetical protein